MTSRRIASSALILASLALAAPASAQAPMTPVQQQAANAAALGQGQVPAAAPGAPTTQGAIQALSNPDNATPAPAALGVPATATPAGAVPAAAAAADAATHPGIVPGVSPSTAPPPESKDDVHKPFHRSLFFAGDELVQIQQALKGIISPINGPIDSIGKPIPQVRTITLTGVLYKGPDDWLIWLNGQKLNPHVLLKEIVDIKVERDLVHLSWFDIGLNGVINVDMRPHQKYDIVTGLMLPVPPGE